MQHLENKYGIRESVALHSSGFLRLGFGGRRNYSSVTSWTLAFIEETTTVQRLAQQNEKVHMKLSFVPSALCSCIIDSSLHKR